jgi:hypothetical protein
MRRSASARHRVPGGDGQLLEVPPEVLAVAFVNGFDEALFTTLRLEL